MMVAHKRAVNRLLYAGFTLVLFAFEGEQMAAHAQIPGGRGNGQTGTVPANTGAPRVPKRLNAGNSNYLGYNGMQGMVPRVTLLSTPNLNGFLATGGFGAGTGIQYGSFAGPYVGLGSISSYGGLTGVAPSTNLGISTGFGGINSYGLNTYSGFGPIFGPLGSFGVGNGIYGGLNPYSGMGIGFGPYNGFGAGIGTFGGLGYLGGFGLGNGAFGGLGAQGPFGGFGGVNPFGGLGNGFSPFGGLGVAGINPP
jgi:hypothetical protein